MPDDLGVSSSVAGLSSTANVGAYMLGALASSTVRPSRGTSSCGLVAGLEGLRCILVDRPGCGLPDPIMGGPLRDLASVEAYADRLLPDLLDALELERAMVGATSYGVHTRPEPRPASDRRAAGEADHARAAAVGEHDPNGGAAVARAFAPRLPDAEPAEVPDAEHAPWIDDPTTCLTHTQAFLSG